MPVYEYACGACGGFAAERPMAEYDLPAPCPACGQAAPRALTLPQVAGMDGARRTAMAVNERSAYAPRSARTEGTGVPVKPRAPVKGFAGARPWMISH
ncbi:MAG TPA: zinc ribbon domain-containing protein [Acetobacteraceae bacterium]|nr:zinc ribbon domain-containing protein [Acetobacteraceae bacterium]